jgi:hypothetical protein
MKRLVGLMAVLALGLALAACEAPSRAPSDLETFDDILEAAEADEYWALDRLRDGEVSWEDLEFAHERWRECVEGLGLKLHTVDSWTDPTTGYFAGWRIEWDDPDNIPDLREHPQREAYNACMTASDPAYLEMAYQATHEPVFDPALFGYLLNCLRQSGMDVDRSATTVREVATSLGAEEGRKLPIIHTCVNEGVKQLYPDIGFVEFDY